MEEELGEERRALVLETAMRKGGNPATLPKSFATPEMASMEEPSMIETVVTTVRHPHSAKQFSTMRLCWER